MTSANKPMEIVREMIAAQQEKLLRYGREIIPTLTTDDLLQPNDYPELENHPLFRHEEGFLSALLAVQMALQALENGSR